MKKTLPAIIFTDRSDVRNAVRDELRRIGLKSDDLHAPSDQAQMLVMINKLKEAVLILDWDAGAESVLSVLEMNVEKGKQDAHSVFLITSKVDQNIVAAASEFSVDKIHSGEISSLAIKEALTAIFKAAQNESPIKKLLKKMGEYKKSGDYDKVDGILAPLYEKMPTNPRIAVEYGENLIEIGDLKKAKEVLTVAAKAEPPYARAKHALAKVFLKEKNPTMAVNCMQGAQLISPYNVNRLLEMGEIFLDLGEASKAKSSFDDAMSIAPKSKRAVAGKGTAMLDLGEVNEALSLIKESANSKELASIFNTAAILAMKKGDHDNAMNLYKTALNAVQNNKKVESRLWYNLGIGYVKWRKPKKSLDCFKKSVELDANYENAAHNIAVMEKALGGPQQKGSVSKARAEAKDDLMDLGNLDESLTSDSLSQGFENLNFDLDFDNDLDDD